MAALRRVSTSPRSKIRVSARCIPIMCIGDWTSTSMVLRTTVEKATGPHPGPNSPWVPLITESSDKRPNPIRFTRPWRVRNKVTGRGYMFHDNIADGSADTWADADHWVLLYHPNEQDDGRATSGPMRDAVHISRYLNGENVDGQDVVIWYHAGHQHVTPLTCVGVGPRIVPFGPW
jgi:hypothetical protein